MKEGYLAAGYNYVGIDDCWLEKERDSNNRMVADRQRFPSGIMALADYPNYSSIAKHCNLWRNYGDIQDSWTSLKNIMQWFAKNQDELVKYAGPGHWNDPDMLDQARVQMAVWSILAAPLLMSVDLAIIRPEFKEVLLNEDVIAVRIRKGS
ncbi:unnamed protein product [Parnassius apollo]|uniref:(apollo) hypothetical protein n=1 Tax=Parnassius apollo TaxID=110799 RepID=A0A8S3XNN1_PARAO|nr:unnamed protein product [Parnassius apollo]